MPAAAPFLPIIAFDGNSPDLEFDPNDSTVATGDMFKIFGSVDNDNIIVRQVPSVLGNTRRFPFEMANVEFLKVRGGDGFDDIVNYSGDLGLPSVRSLLEGQGGNDILLGGITQDNINEITNENRNVDVIAGGAGADYLAGSFADSVIDNDGDDFLFADVDLTSTSSGIAIPDPPGLGDFLNGGTGRNSAFQIGGLDIVAGINGALTDGGACKDVITWLRAKINSGGNQSASQNLNQSIEVAFDALGFDWGLQAASSTAPVTSPPVTNLPVTNPALTNPPAASPPATGSPVVINSLSMGEGEMRYDVNADGVITANDALRVINQLSRQSVPANSVASGEQPARGSETRHPADVNGDGKVTAQDALLIINQLGRRSANASGEAPATLITQSKAATPDIDDRTDVRLGAVPQSQKIDPAIDQSSPSSWAAAVDQAMQISDDQASDDSDQTLLFDLRSQSSISEALGPQPSRPQSRREGSGRFTGCWADAVYGAFGSSRSMGGTPVFVKPRVLPSIVT